MNLTDLAAPVASLLILQAAVVVVLGGIIGLLSDSWEVVVGTHAAFIACGARLHLCHNREDAGPMVAIMHKALVYVGFFLPGFFSGGVTGILITVRLHVRDTGRAEDVPEGDRCA
jgi:hypothetical protein